MSDIVIITNNIIIVVIIIMMLLTGEVGKSEGSTDGRNRGEGDGQGAGEDPHLLVRIIVTMPSSMNNITIVNRTERKMTSRPKRR